MGTPSWQKKRKEQGRSYAEVVVEIRRRAAGNYLFSNKENAVRLRRALKDAALLYKLSANLHDFLEAQQLDSGVPLDIFGDSAVDDAMRVMLDPVPSVERGGSIENDGLIDLLYPGVDFEVERGITLVYIKKREK